MSNRQSTTPHYSTGPCERCGTTPTGIIRHDCSGMSDKRAHQMRRLWLEIYEEERAEARIRELGPEARRGEVRS